MGILFWKHNENKIVCPYCFAQFGADEVHFRGSRHDKTPKEVDEKLKAFCIERKISEASKYDNLEKAYDPKVPGSGKSITKKFTDINGKKIPILTEFIPSDSGIPTSTRLCKECHNVLPSKAGTGKSKVIAVLGTTQIGKTVYINSLITQLWGIAKRLKNAGKYSFTLQDDAGTYKKTKNAIELGSAEPTKPEYIAPLLSNIGSENGDIIVSFYDFPGETTAEQIKDFSIKQGKYADGIIMLFDLTRTKTLSQAANKLRQKELEEDINDLLKTINVSSEISEKFEAVSIELEDVDVLEMFYKSALQKYQNSRVANTESDIENKKDIHGRRSSSTSGEYTKEKVEEAYNEYIAAKAKFDRFSQALKNAVGDPDFEVTQNVVDVLKQVAFIRDNIKRIGRNVGSVIDKKKTPLDWIEDVYNSWFNAAETATKDKRPVALVGTKSDEIYRAAQMGCISNAEVCQGIEMLREPIDYANGFDDYQATRISTFVSNQLLHNDNNFLNGVDKRFENYCFFAVSALGTRYVTKDVDGKAEKELDGLRYEYVFKKDSNGNLQKDGKGRIVKEKILIDKIEPWRVDEPLYWVFNQLGII